jgi:peptidoglycan hydrolase CwlO-like protein
MNRYVILVLFSVCLLSSCGPTMDERIAAAQTKAEDAQSKADSAMEKAEELESKISDLEDKVQQLEDNQ